ncbi:OmpA family protein [Vibrio sp. M260118]|uniref:OmpA family protein n=1 Tax=Vibrio sp. M260118 TaxID=3020896 RepID=UPI002F3EF9D6
MKKLAVIISSTLAVVSMNANAEFYLGGKVGKSWLDDACLSTTQGCDDDSTAAGVMAGYQFMDYVSLEAGYDYLGEFTAAGLSDDKVHAFTLAPKLDFSITEMVSLYGKLGGAYVDYGDKDDMSFLGAVGMEVEAHKNLSFRLEYQHLTDVNNDLVRAAVDTATIGFVYKFGASEQTAAEPYVAEEKVVEEVVVAEPVVATPVLKTFETQVVDSGAFALNSSELKPESKPMLDELVEFMNKYPQSTVEVTGYTDSSGAASYNQSLSEKRAQTIADVLLKEGIDGSRITAKGEGENNPIASNDTREGRAKNRRVEVVVPAFEYEAE